MEIESDGFPQKEPCLQELVFALDSLNKPQDNILLNTPGNPSNCLFSDTSNESRAQTEVVSSETLDSLKNLKIITLEIHSLVILTLTIFETKLWTSDVS